MPKRIHPLQESRVDSVMRILLVQPTSNPIILGNYFNIMTVPETLALEALAPRAWPQEARIIDRRMGADLSAELRSYRPDVVGVTAHITEVYDAHRVLQEAKSFNPKILTLVGGHGSAPKKLDRFDLQ